MTYSSALCVRALRRVLHRPRSCTPPSPLCAVGRRRYPFWLGLVLLMAGMPRPWVQAQPYREGSMLLEPLVGFVAGPTAVDYGDDVRTAFGIRWQGYRTYRRSLLVELLVLPSRDHADRRSNWQQISFGTASTLVDRDATGTVGMYLVIGLGVMRGEVRYNSEYSFLEDGAWWSLLFPMTALFELNVADPLLFRIGLSATVGYTPDQSATVSDGFWGPALGLTPSIGIVF